MCFELTGKLLLAASVVTSLLTVALQVVVQFWAPNLNPAVVLTTGLVGLILANGFSARVYGEIGTLTSH